MITLGELKIGFLTMFEKEFNIHSFLSGFLPNSIMIFQIYYYSDLPDLQEKLFGFFMGYIVYKLTQLLTNYYQSYISSKLQNYFLDKKYTEMSETFKQSLITSIIIHVITYFPIKWLVMYIFTNTYLTKQNPTFVGGSIAKVGQYITIHFWSALFAILTKAISQIFNLFNLERYVTYGNIISLLINIIFGVFYRSKYGDDYFVRGLSFADVVGELCVAIFYIAMQQMSNPLTHDLMQINFSSITNTWNYIAESFDIYGFVFWILNCFYDEIFMLLYVFFFVSNYDITWYNFYFISFIFKNMFFKCARNDQMEVYNFYNNLSRSTMDNFNPSSLTYDFDSEAKNDKNFSWMFFIKRKIITILALNIFLGIIFIIFYLINGYYIVEIRKSDLLVIILFAVDGIIEELGLFVKNVEGCIFQNSQIFNAFGLGLIISIVAYAILYFIFKSMSAVVLVMYLTFYFIFFKFYPVIKNTDMKLINLKMQIKMDNNEKSKIEDTPDSSFERIDVNLIK